MIDYFAGLVMNHFEGKKLPRKLCLIVSVVMNLGLLGVFKYSGFIAENINAIAGSQIIDINNMNFFGIDFLPMNMLPIGISFFTFQSMSYTIDLYMGNVKVQKNPISFAAFVTLFPQIVAGPIVRYDDVAKELDDRTITIDLIYDGIIRFIIGLSKKSAYRQQHRRTVDSGKINRHFTGICSKLMARNTRIHLPDLL